MLTRDNTTPSHWIAGPTGRADADWIVVNDSALSVSAASSRTRILTLEIETSLRWSTLRAGHALRSTIWWNSQVVWLTRADGRVPDWSTDAIGPARRRFAGLFDKRWSCRRNFWDEKEVEEKLV